MKNRFVYILFFLLAIPLFAQTTDTLKVKEEKILVIKDTTSVVAYDPLAPARAAFYSAVLPGLGQAYNHRYWKIPIIYAGMATGIYFYLRNDKEYDRFRDAYKRRLAGYTDDEFFGNGETAAISIDRLRDAQKTLEKNKDYSIIVTLIFYLLNVVDANVDAHLQQFNISEDLSFKPNVEVSPLSIPTNYGVSLSYRFK